jgi:uroporphyrinogen decarboxylase
MTQRECLKALFHYGNYDYLPVAHFGWWEELLQKWQAEGHLTKEEIDGAWDGSEKDRAIGRKLGFDFNYYTTFGADGGLVPAFEPKIVREFPDGSKHIMGGDGVIVLSKPGAHGIPSEIGHTLVDRKSWEELYLPRLQWDDRRLDENRLRRIALETKARTEPLGLYMGSLFGNIRNWMGIEGVSYLYADDEDLYDEIIRVNADLQYRGTEKIITIAESLAPSAGDVFDFGHFWEDIAFRSGPLVSPRIFYEKLGPHYKRLCDLCRGHGIDIVSLDCDGDPAALIPTWLENGVNTMFPIEVGVWGGSFTPWREKHGKALRGVGGMNKHVLAADRSAVDREIERLKPIVELGGYLPCPDHRLPPNVIWENVQYYCDKFRETFK